MDDVDPARVRHLVLDRDRQVTDGDLPDADVVIATWWETAEWVARLSPAKGAKCLFLQHFEVHDPATAHRVEAVWRLPLHKIVIAKWLENLARERFSDASSSLVPNGVDPELFHSGPRRREHPPTVGFVYSGIAFKRSDLALAAFSKLRERIPEVRLLAFGAEPMREAGFPADGEFHLRPPQDRLRTLYSRCDVWLCSSDTEGFALPLLEAMACRTPVVSTRSGGPEDFVEDGSNGYLSAVGDAEGLADRLHALLACDPSRWEAMSQAAHRTAMRHSWDRSQDLFERALHRAIERAARGEIEGGKANVHGAEARA